MSKNNSAKQLHKYDVKARIDKTQQNSRRRLCGDKDKPKQPIAEVPVV